MSQLVLYLVACRPGKKIWLALLVACAIQVDVIAQTTATFDARSLGVEWQLVQNRYQDKAQFLATLTLINNQQQSVPSSGWKLYFSLRYHGISLTSTTPAFTIHHVNGDLFYLAPTKSFTGLPTRQSVTVNYYGNGRVGNFQDAPSGLFWVNDSDSQKAVTLHEVQVKPLPDALKLNAANQALFYAENSAIENIPESLLPGVFPTPVEYHKQPSVFVLDQTISIVSEPLFLTEANYLADQIQTLIGKRLAINPTKPTTASIVLKKAPLNAEAYQLSIQPTKITCSAGDGAGIFYSIQSLKALFKADAWKAVHSSISLSSVSVSDAPRFPYRGFMLDVARNFQSKKAVLRLLDVMSMYKLNVFHFHLTDDEGWRLEIPGLPELTTVGANRGFPFASNQRLQPSYGSGPDAAHSYGSGHYSRADFIEILHYATQRHIRVIPELEMPGHARAAIKAMQFRYDRLVREGKKAEADRYRLDDPQDSSRYVSAQFFTDNVMNVARPSTYLFVEKVVDEVQRMYKEAAAPLPVLHVGGDEVPHGAWEKSPMVQATLFRTDSLKTAQGLSRYFFSRIKALLKTRSIAMEGWEELVVQESASDKVKQITMNADYQKDQVILDAWMNLAGNEDTPYRLANAGYSTILACFDHFYFDLPNKPGFAEPGDAWIGYLGIDKLFRFIPFDYYRTNHTDVSGNARPTGYFDKKAQLLPSGQQHIVGLKGALWSENMRADSLLDQQILPRLLALAERSWAKNPAWTTEKDSILATKSYRLDLSIFMNTLGKRELPKLDYYADGYHYDLPTIGAIVRSGYVLANTQFPGFQLRYAVGGKEPTTRSPLYSKPIATKGIIKLAIFDSRGRRGKSVELVTP